MFYGVSSLNPIVLMFSTSSCIIMSYMFKKCRTSLLNLNSFDTSNVIDMTRMFNQSVIDEIYLSRFETSKVYDMTHMFYGASIESVDVSNFDTSNVRYMSSMFTYMQTTVIEVSRFSTQKVEEIADFMKSAKVEYLDLFPIDFITFPMLRTKFPTEDHLANYIFGSYISHEIARMGNARIRTLLTGLRYK